MNDNVEHWQVRKAAIHHPGGMVAAQHHLAARAGAALLHDGGNAVDAAIAAALALGVVEPWMCGLGGSGLMTIWLAREKRAVTIDFQGVLAGETAPEDYPIDPDLPPTIMGFPTVRDRVNVEGYRAITLPGAAAGFDLAAARYGTRGLPEIAAPAILMAKTGIPADWFTNLQISLEMAVIGRDPVSAAIYLPEGRPVPPESHWRIPGLAETLTAFSEGGAESFYRGPLAERIVADLRAGGSRISLDDMAAYRAQEAEAVHGSHRGRDLYSLGDASGGTRLRDCLAHFAEAIPTPPPSPTPATWKIYADGLEAAWHAHKRRFAATTEAGACTSHLSTADSEGNMVALTHTLLNRFGSGVTLPQTGLLMNNSVAYFDPRPGYPTTMAPHMRINSSNMCPTIAVREGTAEFALGASGATLIMPAVTQVAALMLDFGMSLEQALNSPRIDASARGSIRADPALGPEVLAELGRHYDLEVAQRLVFPKLYACVSGVAWDTEARHFTGLNDPSQPIGGAAGPAAFTLDEETQSRPEARP